MPSEAHDVLVEAAKLGRSHFIVRSDAEKIIDAVLSARLQQPCETCGGSGRVGKLGMSGNIKVYSTPCNTCFGAGTVLGDLAIVQVLVERGVLIKVAEGRETFAGKYVDVYERVVDLTDQEGP